LKKTAPTGKNGRERVTSVDTSRSETMRLCIHRVVILLVAQTIITLTSVLPGRTALTMTMVLVEALIAVEVGAPVVDVDQLAELVAAVVAVMLGVIRGIGLLMTIPVGMMDLMTNQAVPL
jgi:hypothetical protein